MSGPPRARPRSRSPRTRAHTRRSPHRCRRRRARRRHARPARHLAPFPRLAPYGAVTAIRFADFDALTFDCYGTLVDWEQGILAGVRPVLRTHGIELTDDEVLET